MKLPEPRGPISSALIARFDGPAEVKLPRPDRSADPLSDEDLQLSLHLCYELHYRGFAEADAELEWDPGILGLRGELEGDLIRGLAEAVPGRRRIEPERLAPLLFKLAEVDAAPSPSRFLERSGQLEHFREFIAHRSAYQLKEADPHSWAIPRLDGAAKAALVEVQYDEYGSGSAERIHARLFADAMEALGLDSSYGAYIDLLPAHTLATVNLMSLFGLHRRWRGAIVGHLAMFEITSPEPNRRYAHGLRRLGLEAATPFFDEHVEADSVHENIAAYDMAEGLARAEPGLVDDIVWGADCLVTLEGRWAGHVLDAWECGESSLREPLPAAPALTA